jgi:hypothetical protein
MSDLGQIGPILLAPLSDPRAKFVGALDACAAGLARPEKERPAGPGGRHAISLDPKQLPIGGARDGLAALSLSHSQAPTPRQAGIDRFGELGGGDHLPLMLESTAHRA